CRIETPSSWKPLPSRFLDKEIAVRLKPYQQQVKLACTVPGIKPTAEASIPAETGMDMSPEGPLPDCHSSRCQMLSSRASSRKDLDNARNNPPRSSWKYVAGSRCKSCLLAEQTVTIINQLHDSSGVGFSPPIKQARTVDRETYNGIRARS